MNEENSSIELFINGESALISEIPQGLSADLSDSLYYFIGGKHPIRKDDFFGEIDDLRFYNTALDENEMLAIYNDDVSGQPIARISSQAGHFDEGTDSNGLLLVNDEGKIRARVLENGNYCRRSVRQS